jgi:DNA topoisomerase-1
MEWGFLGLILKRDLCDKIFKFILLVSNMILIIVESPAKCKKIEEYLGTGFKCLSTMGHFRQLNGLKSIDTKKNYAIKWDVSTTKKANVMKLHKEIKNASNVVLATDDDREGEAIAWHICDHYGLPVQTTKRMIFREITKKAIQDAYAHLTDLRMDIVYAQRTRQILDLTIGFKISPLLWKHIDVPHAKALSAGRCQTPALNIIYDNQKEIDDTSESTFYKVGGHFTSKNIEFILCEPLKNAESMETFLEDSVNFEHVFSKSEPHPISKNSPLPFHTSSLQQATSNAFHMSPKETMSVCQKLYEKGKITYMRTDSRKLSSVFIRSASEYITNKWSKEYVALSFQHIILEDGGQEKKKKDNSQNAHEGIRPTHIGDVTVEGFTPREKKVYELIWKTTVQSCMSNAEGTSFQAFISAPISQYKHVFEKIHFPGWKVLEKEGEDKFFTFMLQMKNNEKVVYKKIYGNLQLTSTKSHYTEARLVQLLEKMGIGRPSTYSSLVDKIQERKYVVKEDVKGKTIDCVNYMLKDDTIEINEETKTFGNEKSKLVLQPLGRAVFEFLKANFDNLFHYDYTNQMENKLDMIEKKEVQWLDLCNLYTNDVKDTIKTFNASDVAKTSYVFDSKHTYVIGKYGPIIQCKDDDDNITWKKLKTNITKEDVFSGKYALEDVIDHESCVKEVTLYYQKHPVAIKTGKYGKYFVYKEKNISIPAKYADSYEEHVDEIISNHSSDIIRNINDEMSLRKGKYGDYIFYKTKTMNKPKFIPLKGFACDEPYTTCDESLLIRWVQEYKPPPKQVPYKKFKKFS